MWIFLLVAAGSLVVLITSIFPTFPFECRRVYGHAEVSVLEICVLLHRLPGILMHFFQKLILLSG
ncbi:uncharacterized protein N7518_004510 [Penicillium psychrosexuale]|uniref:uncharacterized protein n=1 Tax=Penicillium psychrosexuale TaxID=1002107 RepID=UPI002545009A|nr:uncharacterized protein N7518_004510 [Penicillium psychrosexuale]KAJ5795970.1 hypothetical protein N7518_004510 [Penicillium psychrosexuale]